MQTWEAIEAEVEQLFADKPRVKEELLKLIAMLEGVAFDHLSMGEIIGWFSDFDKDEATMQSGYLIAYATGAVQLLTMRFELHHDGKVVELSKEAIGLSFSGVKDLDHPELGLVPDFAKSTYIYFTPGAGVPASDPQG